VQGLKTAYPERKEQILANIESATIGEGEIDRTRCDLVERIPGKVSGRTIVVSVC